MVHPQQHHVVVGKCYMVLKHRHGAENMRPCCGDQVFPGARRDCQLVGTKLFLGLAMAQRCGDWVTITWGSHNNDKAELWGPAPAWGSQWLGLAIFHHLQESQRDVTQICGDQVAPAHRQWAEIGGDGARARLPNGSAPCGPHNGALQTTATAAHRLLPADHRPDV